MLPKKGKGFPKRDGKGGGGVSYAEAIATALRRQLGDTHQAVKTVMRWTGAGERTAKNWLTAGGIEPDMQPHKRSAGMCQDRAHALQQMTFT